MVRRTEAMVGEVAIDKLLARFSFYPRGRMSFKRWQ